MGKVMAIINSARGTFVYGILTKWYLAIVVPALGITYVVFTKLDQIGVFDMIFAELNKDLIMIDYVASVCVEKILDFDNFLRCLSFGKK
jgi:hypothetical protein